MKHTGAEAEFTEYCLSFRSVTYAQRAKRILDGAGIFCYLHRAPSALAAGGCGYCVSLRKDVQLGVQLLKAAGIPYSRIFGKMAAGEYQEAAL